MKYTTLGQTNMQVSTICMGTWAFAGDITWGDQDDADSINTVHAALDVGLNFFDTAEMYGDGYSEQVLGKALAGKRQEAIIASKVGDHNLLPADVRAACEASLKRLQTDYIDLYQVHWPSREVPLADTMGALEELKAEGKIRAIGISNFGVEDMKDLLALGRVESNQLCYSLLWRAIEYEILPKCIAEDIGVLCYSPLMHGLLTGKFATIDDVPEGRARTRHYSSTRPLTRHNEPGCEEETFAALADIRQISAELNQPMLAVAVAWVLHQAGVASVITGARNVQQIQEIAAVVDLDLSEAVIAHLNTATEPVKEHIGKNADMWQTQSRIR